MCKEPAWDPFTGEEKWSPFRGDFSGTQMAFALFMDAQSPLLGGALWCAHSFDARPTLPLDPSLAFWFEWA